MSRGKHLGELEELVLLAVAGLAAGAHGAAIHVRILEATGRDVSIPAVYVTLSRLEKKRLVTSAVDLEGLGRGGRPRKVFTVTDRAVEALSASRLSRSRLWASVDFDPIPTGDVG